jgi:hypothetical protein
MAFSSASDGHGHREHWRSDHTAHHGSCDFQQLMEMTQVKNLHIKMDG